MCQSWYEAVACGAKHGGNACDVRRCLWLSGAGRYSNHHLAAAADVRPCAETCHPHRRKVRTQNRFVGHRRRCGDISAMRLASVALGAAFRECRLDTPGHSPIRSRNGVCNPMVRMRRGVTTTGLSIARKCWSHLGSAPRSSNVLGLDRLRMATSCALVAFVPRGLRCSALHGRSSLAKARSFSGRLWQTSHRRRPSSGNWVKAARIVSIRVWALLPTGGGQGVL